MRKIFKKVIIFFSVVIGIGIIVFCFLFVGKAKQPIGYPENITWGVDFSQMQAESLGLDWKETYLAIIDDLGAKNIKIHTQWDWVEGKKGEFYFDDIDWQLQKAKEKGVKIIYVLGLKTGRWPECHAPAWVDNLSEQQQKENILNYIKKVVERYKNNNAIAYWQVENEPMYGFGKCPNWYYKNIDFLKEEVSFVKQLDSSRKIIVSDSGESSMWFKAAKIGDIVGTTLYREAWAHVTENFGFPRGYLFTPVYYSRKAFIIKKFFGKEVFCVELQAEPWGSKQLQDMSVGEQLKILSLQKFKKNVIFAKNTGLNKFYFWGVEWWYWLKEKQNHSEIWDEAKTIFN